MTLKHKLTSKALTIGSWLNIGSPFTCEIMAKADFEWLVVDMEHAALSASQMLHLIQIIELAGLAPIVRVGANDPLLIKRAMDAGAHGVVVPMVNTVEDASQALEALYYPPRGRRGVGLSRAQHFGLGFDEYRARAATETVFVAQIEHHEGVNNLSDILALDGVDGFIVGPYDMSASLGVPGQFAHPAMLDCMNIVTRTVQEHAKPGGVHIVHPDAEELSTRIEEGYRFIAYGVDMLFLAEKAHTEGATVRALREATRIPR